MKVVMIGSGYVGLTTGVALSYIGHEVSIIDIDVKKIDKLKNRIPPFHEQGLEQLLQETSSSMSFYDHWEGINLDVDIIILAVGTPSKSNNEADLSYVEDAARQIGNKLTRNMNPLIVNKSTVPIGAADKVKQIIMQTCTAKGFVSHIQVASNPEFLREGEALYDSFYPDRIIVGVDSDFARNQLYSLYQPILERTFKPLSVLPKARNATLPPFISTSPNSAELIKYAANSFLAMKISFINEFANLAEQVGADITEVARGIGLDERIGTRFLNAGIGWGGSCFGKDTRAIIQTGKQYGSEMSIVQTVVQTNDKQRELVVKKLQNYLKVLRGKTIGILGLAFKPNTDDIRDAPSIDIIQRLIDLGVYVQVYDPLAMEQCKLSHPSLDIHYTETAEEVFNQAHAIILVTEWEEFRTLSYQHLVQRMRNNLVIDGRNFLNGEIITEYGYTYSGIGKGS
ncbi:UDP-glucose dehydrogenase family protein [Chengkuizengella axinellae]|uniref:UDP-glucose 6-dehydrogenase n=1 Tax=Chengkuizengella axinellae TaxID=3064388 RepID=A0ABT9J4G6_9BACL|nr:UDP-glucose/GDP-mannose dehydrogenase family protein [Chengkuizengella sp. 2205SS18-9]MDP5276526.1 UDP-glucose/GDP-mannose dehydrogenase family protein [Chengkuizengella sp. 2205SS18-9]